MKHFSLFDLHQYIERVFLLNFEEHIWIEAEIAEINLNNGNYYISLIDKTETGGLLAQASAALWRSQVPKLQKKLGSSFAKILQPGSKVRVLCDVKFHPRYGYKLHFLDLDLDYSMGQYFLERQRTIARLEENKLFGVNKSQPLAEVIQRIAVISSPHAAGYQDFVHQLENNPFGYTLHHDLFAAKMQGDGVTASVLAAMESIKRLAKQYDIIVLVRGGGGSVDLSDFDQYEVAECIARAPMPVLCGIGHDKDLSVTDLIAYQSVKTPTAAAEYILYHNQKYESDLIDIYNQIKILAKKNFHIFQDENARIQSEINRIVNRVLQNEQISILQLKNQCFFHLNQNWKKELRELNTISQNFAILNPQEAMNNGYAMIIQNKTWIKNLQQLQPQKAFTIHLNTDKVTIHDEEQKNA